MPLGSADIRADINGEGDHARGVEVGRRFVTPPHPTLFGILYGFWNARSKLPSSYLCKRKHLQKLRRWKLSCNDDYRVQENCV